jgi:hypothetical protein
MAAGDTGVLGVSLVELLAQRLDNGGRAQGWRHARRRRRQLPRHRGRVAAYRETCKPVDDNQVRVEALEIHDGYKQTCEAITTLGLLPMLSDAEKQKHTAQVHAR